MNPATFCVTCVTLSTCGSDLHKRLCGAVRNYMLPEAESCHRVMVTRDTSCESVARHPELVTYAVCDVAHTRCVYVLNGHVLVITHMTNPR